MSTSQSASADSFADVSVAIITRDEEETIAEVIEACFAQLPGTEVVVVDGSSDTTPEIAAATGAKVSREPPGGFAPALLAALKGSDRPIVVTIDADLTYPVEVLPELVRRIRDGDDVAGTDRLGSWQRQAMSLPNWLASVVWGLIASARARRRIRDLHSAERAYRRTVIDEFEWDTEGPAFPVDLLMWPACAGYRVSEIPIEYRPRVAGVSKLQIWRGTVVTMRRLLRPKSRMKPVV